MFNEKRHNKLSKRVCVCDYMGNRRVGERLSHRGVTENRSIALLNYSKWPATLSCTSTHPRRSLVCPTHQGNGRTIRERDIGEVIKRKKWTGTMFYCPLISFCLNSAPSIMGQGEIQKCFIAHTHSSNPRCHYTLYLCFFHPFSSSLSFLFTLTWSQ